MSMRGPYRLRSSTRLNMPWPLLCVWCTFLLAAAVDCINLPSINWTTSNPMFKASNNDHIVQVHINDEIDFVCPYVKGELPDDENKHEFYIIYQVTKEEYDSCMLYTVRKKHLVVNCSTPRQRKRFTIIFERYSSIPNGQEYKSGEAYYFITTSVGPEHGLDNAHLGACYHKNLKLTIRVCCQETTLTTAQLPSTIPHSPSPNTTHHPLLPVHPGPLSSPTPHTTRATPTATTTLPTTPTTVTTTTTRRTTPSTRSRWKYPTTPDKYPNNKHDGKKDENDNDYHHENEVLPNKEQLVNAGATLLHQMAPLVLLCLSALLARAVALR